MADAKIERASPRPVDSDAVLSFARSLKPLVRPGQKIGVAVSGGPDSLALLLLASAARPGMVEAATVDHRLRPESASEAEAVSKLSEQLGVPHSTLTAEWSEPPTTGIQERARAERYRLLGRWAKTKSLDVVLTAHHLDDQAETFMMRLARGAGVSGLAAMRPLGNAMAGQVPLARPLLNWRRWDLQAVCLDAGVRPFDDPSNRDPQFERTRIRSALEGLDWLDAEKVATSAAILAEADEAIAWSALQAWRTGVRREGGHILFKPRRLPTEILRRIVLRAVKILANENASAPLRGRELDQLLAMLTAKKQATVRGVLCSGGDEWRFSKAPARRKGPAPVS